MTSYEVITNQIIEKMNEGIIPWVKPWHSNSWKCEGMHRMFPAYSYSNGKRYNFMNQMLLGFEAGEFATFEQIKKAGGKVKKGEKSTIVAGWIVDTKPLTDKDGNALTDEDGNEETKTTFALRYYRVFNILTQCEGIEPKHNWTKDEAPESDLQPEEAAEAIIENYITSKDAPKFTVLKGSDKAYYSPAFDEVVIPHMSQFEAIAEYYSTAFHELTHSTSKETRCNRKTTGKKAAFGSKEYSKEELVAEIGSCFLNSQAGLTTESSFRNSTAYLQNWITVLKNDPKMIIQASTQAEKATEFILNATGTTPDKGSKPEAKATNKKTDANKGFDFIAKRTEKGKNIGSYLVGKANGYTYASDGVQLIRTTENLTDKEADNPSMIATFDKILSENGKGKEIGTVPYTAKEFKKLMTEAKNGKRNAKVIYTTPEGITFNAQFLYNAILATGANAFSYVKKNSPAVFDNDHTSYLLCPIHATVENPEGFKLI